MRPAALFGAAIGLLCSLSQSFAQPADWPSRPLKWVVAFAPGGATDIVARLMAAKYQEILKQPVIVENRAGASGNTGADAVAKSAPDGYTFLFAVNGLAISPSIYAKLPFDPDADLVRVTNFVSLANVLISSNKREVKSLPELVALASSKPGSLNYGSSGVGNSLHLTMEVFKRETQTDIVMVPFRGDAPLLQAMMTGDVQLAVVPAPAARAHIEAGNVRALGVSTLKRVPTMPNVPTLAEQGVKDFDLQGWMGIFAPRGISREIVVRMVETGKQALAAPDMAPKLAALDLVPVGSTPEEFEALWRADRERFARVVKEANIPKQE